MLLTAARINLRCGEKECDGTGRSPLLDVVWRSRWDAKRGDPCSLIVNVSVGSKHAYPLSDREIRRRLAPFHFPSRRRGTFVRGSTLCGT